MNRLREAFEQLAQRGNPRGAEAVYAAATHRIPVTSTVAKDREGGDAVVSWSFERRRPWAGFAAAFVVVFAVGTVFGVLVLSNSPSGEQVPVGGDTTPPPGPTLPPAESGVPMTVPADSPLSFHAYLPDLHLAWREIGAGSGTEICWRTPFEEKCASDDFFAPATLVVGNGGQIIILTRLPLGGPAPTFVEVHFSDGETATHPLTTPEGIAIQYARVDLREGVKVVSARAMP